jgi:glycosyltransferase involved in cell wall biosynthesis
MITIGKVMGTSINASLKNDIPLEIVPMFTDVLRLKPILKKDNTFCIKNGLSDKFVVLYSGKMGIGHNLEILLEASKFFKDYKDIIFLMIGHGQKYSMVENWIVKNNADNVKIFPLQSEENFPESLASGDIGFVSQEKNAARFFMPAKTYDMMACGMAIVTYSSGDDDLTELIDKYDLGVSLSENKPELLYEVIKELYHNRELLNKYKFNSRKVAIDYFDVRPVSNQYREIFQRLLNFN